MNAELPTGGVIYGIRLRSEFVYRYVGLTTKAAEVRLRQHLKVARSGRRTPFYDWLRAHEGDDVDVDVLDCVDGSKNLARQKSIGSSRFGGRDIPYSICLRAD